MDMHSRQKKEIFKHKRMYLGLNMSFTGSYKWLKIVADSYR